MAAAQCAAVEEAEAQAQREASAGDDYDTWCTDDSKL